MEELISIIVPIYNVENYINKCVDSILNQTYKNLEILLIDDGSPDKCGKICDEYKSVDKRVIVVHKENGGLSDARNIGISLAKGKYISVIDSDDWIETNMIEVLYKNICKYKADISICDFSEEDIEGKQLMEKKATGEIKVFNNEEALNELVIQNNITNHAWNKLYRKELFKNIQYPKGQLMEDVSTTYRLFEESKCIVHQDVILYHYIQRNSSILGNITKKRIIDQENAFFKRNKYLVKKYPKLIDCINVDNMENVKAIYYLSVVGGFKELYASERFKQYYIKYKKMYNVYKNIIREDKRMSMNLFYFNRTLYMLYVRVKVGILNVKKFFN